MLYKYIQTCVYFLKKIIIYPAIFYRKKQLLTSYIAFQILFLFQSFAAFKMNSLIKKEINKTVTIF